MAEEQVRVKVEFSPNDDIFADDDWDGDTITVDATVELTASAINRDTETGDIVGGGAGRVKKGAAKITVPVATVRAACVEAGITLPSKPKPKSDG